METTVTWTQLDIQKLKRKFLYQRIAFILLFLADTTLLIIAIWLFVLIRENIL